MVEIFARVATTGVVQQGNVKVEFTKEALDSFPEQISGDQAVPFTIEHDPYCLPLGKIEEAWVEPFGNEHAVIARIRIEDTFTLLKHRASDADLVLLDFANNPKPFVARSYKGIADGGAILSVDLANFANPRDYDAFKSDIATIDGKISCDRGIVRHSLGPEPLFQFVLSNPDITAAMAVGVWVVARIEKFVRYTVDQTLRKVADDISNALSMKLKNILKAYINRRNQDKRDVTTKIVIPSNPELILLVTTKHNEEFPNIELSELTEEMEKYGDILQEADTVVLARVGSNSWEFQYMTTRTGKVIGTIDCHNRTLEKLQNMNQNSDTKTDTGPPED